MPRPSLAPRSVALALGAMLALSACATPPPDADPLEGVNRASHALNKGVDTVVVRPVSLAYGTVVPAPVRQSVSNVSDNLSQPSRMINGVLQGDFESAGQNFLRFLVNTTFGLGGLFDPATDMGLNAEDTDFGETLHVWGSGEGPYVELPLLGPSTGRDAIGTAVDFVLDPVGSIEATTERQAVTTVRVLEVVDGRYENRGFVDGLLYDSADSYTQTRSIYLQNRRFQLTGEAADPTLDFEVDPFDDPFAIPQSN